MPRYTYMCSVCGDWAEIIKSMDDNTVPAHCDKKMVRDFQADLPHMANKDYARAIHSDALAIHPDQRTEHKKLFPNIQIDGQNRPVFANYRDHQNYLDKCNMRKVRQKIRKKGKKITL